jgi:hypothetical protein
MAEAEQPTIPIPVLTEASTNEARSIFSPEERGAIRASLLGVSRQRGVELSEADLQDRAENALLAHEEFARQVATRKVRSWTEQRKKMLSLKAHILATYPANIPSEFLAALELVTEQVETCGVLIDANSHGRNSFRSTVCWHIMDVWVRAGGKLSAKVTAKQGSCGPLIEHLELMHRILKMPVPARITLRKYVSEERRGRERLLEWLRLHPRPGRVGKAGLWFWAI